MKKKPYKLPFELHDPKVESPRCGQPLDLSDQTSAPRLENVLPQPQPDDAAARPAEF